MDEVVAVQAIAKGLGPSALEKQGKEGVLEANFQYSSLMQLSCLHRNNKPWDDTPRLEA